VNTLEHHDANELKLNEIGSCSVSVNAPVVFDAYKKSKGTGSFIVIDRLSNVTVGAGMITGITDDSDLKTVSAEERAARFSQTATAISLCGAKAEEIVYQLERHLFDNGHAATVLETFNAEFVPVIKHAGLICLTVNADIDSVDMSFDCDKVSIDDIYTDLKAQGVIY
jgi:bifunctional enzyme CysN/CysC